MYYQKTFTVFTPTFNRAYALHRVYESLKNQTFRNFEWLIVDDGSSDNTKELVESWQRENFFQIRYFYQENGGKHRAFNYGVSKARGEFFLTLDSDDKCVPNALERLKFHWDSIEEKDKSVFSAVTVLCMNVNGDIIGSKFPQFITDSDSIEIRNKYNVYGEKWGFQKLEILKKYNYPEYDGEKYIPPALVWNRISKVFKTRYVNEPLRIYEALPDGITASSIKLRMKNPSGSSLYYNEYTTYKISLKNYIIASINYSRFSFHANKNSFEIIFTSYDKLFCIFFIFFGYVFYIRDVKKYKNK